MSWAGEQKKQTLLLTVLPRLMDIAKEMTREALPIKCLEAVILGMYPYNSQSRCMLFNRSHFLARKTAYLALCSQPPALLAVACVSRGIQQKASNKSMLLLVYSENWVRFTSWGKVSVPFVMSDSADSAELYVLAHTKAQLTKEKNDGRFWGVQSQIRDIFRRKHFSS